MHRVLLAAFVCALPAITMSGMAEAQVRSFPTKNVPQTAGRTTPQAAAAGFNNANLASRAAAASQLQAAAQTQLMAQGMTGVRHPALTNRAFALERNISAKAYIASLFPHLRLNSFEIIDPKIGTTYNCIAYSLGVYDRWINPKTGPPANPLGYMDQMYHLNGFQRAQGLDYRVAPGVKKVLLFALVAGGQVQEVTHAAVQQADGSWTSKLGQLPLIRYVNPLALVGTHYGQPVAMYEGPLYPLLWQNMMMQMRQ